MFIPKNNKEKTDFIKNSYRDKPSYFKCDELTWRFAMYCILNNKNVMVRGDTGQGKTMMVQIIRDMLDRPYEVFNCGATTDARSTLIGNTHFGRDAKTKKNGTYVAQSLFAEQIQIPHSLINLEEVSRAHPDAHNILMTVIDDRQRFLRVDEHPDSPTIKVAEGVSFISTANVGTEYTATRTMDRAFIDRWTMVLMHPPTKEDEKALLMEVCSGLSENLASAISEIASDLRVQVKSESAKISTAVSTRNIVDMGNLMTHGFTLEEAAQVQIYPLYSEAGGAESELTYVKQIVQKFTVAPEPVVVAGSPFELDINTLNGGRDKPWLD